MIVPLEQPIKRTGHLQIMYGNIAPEGCVGKITGKEGLAYEGTARCFDKEEDMLDALAKDPSSFKAILLSFLMSYLHQLGNFELNPSRC